MLMHGGGWLATHFPLITDPAPEILLSQREMGSTPRFSVCNIEKLGMGLGTRLGSRVSDNRMFITLSLYLICSVTDAREAMRRNAKEALKVSQTIKKVAKKHRSESNEQETKRKEVVGTSCMLKVPTAQDHLQATTDYARIERKAQKYCQKIEESVSDAQFATDSTVTEIGDYMKLIKTPEGFLGAASASDYQKLHLRDSRTTSEPDYDYTSNFENDYQPLLLANVKGLSNSRDSIYQALFSSPD